MMERMGLEVTVIDSPWGEGANEEKLAEILKVRTPARSVPADPCGLASSADVCWSLAHLQMWYACAGGY